MSVKPFLSICVPSRNRQIYFQQTIDALRASLRTDIELIFADNSDEPEIMNSFMEEVVADPRVVYLPSTGTPLAMVDNWERTAAAATGEYMVFIGDDDYVDPDVAGFMQKVLQYNPGIDGFGWRLMGFTWPYEGRPKLSTLVPFDSSVVKIPQPDLFKRMFGWFDSRHVPTSGFSVYHNAISRRLMERIKTVYGGRFFEHLVVDYDNAFKVICLGNNFVATSRPFGVMGSCPASNSFAVGKREDFRKKMEVFALEAGKEVENDEAFREFPFKAALGTTATIGVAQHWFKTKYNISYENWGETFARACAFDCETYRDPQDFEAAKEGYHTAFSLWEGGRYLKYFKPVYNASLFDDNAVVTAGCTDTGIFIDQDIPAKNSAELFNIVRGMITPIDLLDIQPSGLKFAWETEDKVQKMLRA